MRKWLSENKDYLKEYRANYKPRRLALYHEQREKICAQKKAAAPKYRKRVQEYQRRQRRENIQFCLKDRCRSKVNRALRSQGAKRSCRTFELIGCSVDELKAHLQSLFLPGMSWDNRNLWELDHIKPLVLFDLNDAAQQKLAFNWSNMQPLWTTDNRRKSSKWTG